MELTGKCNRNFIKYLWDNVFMDEESGIDWSSMPIAFSTFPDSMKWGVIQDFADSEYYFLEVEVKLHPLKTVYVANEAEYKTRPEARTKAVELFNKWYNENN